VVDERVANGACNSMTSLHCGIVVLEIEFIYSLNTFFTNTYQLVFLWVL
jgi:hypothetical protein